MKRSVIDSGLDDLKFASRELQVNGVETYSEVP